MIGGIVGILLLLAVSSPARAGFQEGLAAYERYDYAAALDAWRPLAESGDADAEFYLGEMYRQGEGVRRDPAKAVDWYRLAAEQGQAEAQLRLAKMYETGRGVPRDLGIAVRWLHKAAEGGSPEAMYHLGLKYAAGDGVSRSLVRAHEWLALAADRGGDVVGFLAKSHLRDVAARMTPAEIAAAERLARDWTPNQGPRVIGGPAEPAGQTSSPEPAG